MIPGRAAIFARVAGRNNMSKQAMFSILLFSVERRLGDDEWELFLPVELRATRHRTRLASLLPLDFPQCVMFQIMSSNRKVVNICPCNA